MDINLSLYGWNDCLFQQKQSSQFNNLPHGRVTIVHKTCYEVVSGNGMFQCELSGNILYGKSAEEYPCTGDWILFQPTDEGKGIILDILPRAKTLYRKRSGKTSEKQAIAVHIDKAFIVQSLDDNFNVRRIERFMVQIAEEEITPVLVLTKADLDFDDSLIADSLKHLSDKMPIFTISIYSPEKINIVREYIKQGETVVFVGSSGVGKSSLINALCNKDVLDTSHISESTGKGRHTSTRREMVLLDDSKVLIDTPGVREFGITAHNLETLSSTLDISELEKHCRFKDCTHTNEPGCAVLKAVEDGTLERGIYHSFLKLRKEAWHFSSSEYEKRKKDKSFARIVKEVSRLKKNR